MATVAKRGIQARPGAFVPTSGAPPLSLGPHPQTSVRSQGACDKKKEAPVLMTRALLLPTRSGRADSTVAIHKGAYSCAISMISATFESATPPHGDAR